MDLKKLNKEFPFIKKKSETWYFNERTQKFIHKSKLSGVLAYYATKDITQDLVKFKQIDSFKQKRR